MGFTYKKLLRPPRITLAGLDEIELPPLLTVPREGTCAPRGCVSNHFCVLDDSFWKSEAPEANKTFLTGLRIGDVSGPPVSLVPNCDLEAPWECDPADEERQKR